MKVSLTNKTAPPPHTLSKRHIPARRAGGDHFGGMSMETRIADLRYKEVISVEDGSRHGFVADMEIDLETGRVQALIVPGRRRFFGLLGREEDKIIPWGSVKRFGEDIILVER